VSKKIKITMQDITNTASKNLLNMATTVDSTVAIIGGIPEDDREKLTTAAAESLGHAITTRYQPRIELHDDHKTIGIDQRLYVFSPAELVNFVADLVNSRR
jgi:hypothetical protein